MEDSKLIQKLVSHVLDRLNSTSPGDFTDLTGMDAHIDVMDQLLRMEASDEVRIVGICGMGGIGKTTLANLLFKRLSCQFPANCFLENVKGIYTNGGLTLLLERFLSKTLETENFKLKSPQEGSDMMKTRLRQLKILIVLDDLDRFDQLQALIGDPKWFGLGSRIIITTRDKDMLVSHGVKLVYEVKCLRDADALKLFERFAFKEEPAKITYNKQLSKCIVDHTGGLPLALKVLGSFLCGRKEEEWESALCRLDKAPPKDIMEALRISYDRLDEQEKDIFLYVACFFRGESVDRVTKLLDACDFSTEIGINVLTGKCLAEISSSGFVDMHDLLQQMGRELGKHRFSWGAKRSRDMLTGNEETKEVEGISLDMSEVNELLVLNANAFKRMSDLKFLKISNQIVSSKKVQDLPEGLDYIPCKLRLLHWEGYPLKALPLGFNPEYLVELIMHDSKLEKLWKGMQPLWSLRRISLRNSLHLKELPDLSTARSLEILDLGHCESLVEVPSSVQNLNKLDHLDLDCCYQLERLPSKVTAKYVNLVACLSLKRIPEISQTISEFELVRTEAIEELPPSIGHHSGIVSLRLMGCRKLRTLPSTIGNMTSLKLWEIGYCDMLGNLPTTIRNLRSLKTLKIRECPKIMQFPYVPENIETLWLDGTGIKEVSSWNENLSLLKEFHVSPWLDVSMSTLHPSLTRRINAVLGLDRYIFTDAVPFRCLSLAGFKSLDNLSLTSLNMSEIPQDLGQMRNMVELDLDFNCFETIPASIKHLSKLGSLSVNNCVNLRSVPELPKDLKSLTANDCISLEKASPAFRHKVPVSTLRNCFKLQDVNLIIRHLVSTSKESESFATLLPPAKVSDHFSSQAKGSALAVHLPQARLASEIRGFNVGVVISANDPISYHDLCCYCWLHGKDGVFAFVKGAYRRIPFVSFLSDHLSLFSSRRGSKQYNDYVEIVPEGFLVDIVSFEFIITSGEKSSSKIKECGVQLVLIEDLENQCEESDVPSGSASKSTN